jgi:hypothetical protein
MVTTQQTKITCRRDIDDVLMDIESFADWHAERARLDCEAPISAVFTAEEEAAELRSAAATLDQLVMLPIDLYEEVWGVLDFIDNLSTEDQALADLPAILDRLSRYNIR